MKSGVVVLAGSPRAGRRGSSFRSSRSLLSNLGPASKQTQLISVPLWGCPFLRDPRMHTDRPEGLKEHSLRDLSKSCRHLRNLWILCCVTSPPSRGLSLRTGCKLALSCRQRRLLRPAVLCAEYPARLSGGRIG